MLRRVAVIDGARTPFLKSFTDYNNLMGHDLFRHAMLETIERAKIPKETVQYVIAGIVTHESKTSNVAREAILTSGLNPKHVPAHTTTLACISANQAICTGSDMIAQGHVDTVVAGGVEFLSDPPLKLPRPGRQWLMQLNKARSLGQRVGMLGKWKPALMVPEPPAVAEFTTGETMGQSCEKLNAMFKVTRKEQDEFAHRSHQLGDKATKSGLLSDVSPIKVGSKTVSIDNGIRAAPIESLAKLKPAFVKPHGTITAANSTFLTDGAAATLLMSEEKAKKMGLSTQILVKDYTFVAIDPLHHLLLGPAHATHKLLKRNNLKLKDIDVFEYHEAFAGQLLCNLKAMDSDWYTEKMMGESSSNKVGSIPMEKLNTWGGSVSIGHPFGATGSRLVNMAANRLKKEGGKYALIAACAGGGHGHAMIIERVD